LVGEIGFDKVPLTKVEGTKAAMLAHQWVNLGPRTNNGAAKTCLVPSHCAKGNPITCNINTLTGFKQISNTFLWYTRWYTGLEWQRSKGQGPMAKRNPPSGNKPLIHYQLTTDLCPWPAYPRQLGCWLDELGPRTVVLGLKASVPSAAGPLG